MFEAGSADQFFVSSHAPRLLPQGYDIYKHFDKILMKNLVVMTSCFPVKAKAMHMCMGSGKLLLGVLKPLLKQMAGKDNRLHIYTHVSCCARGSRIG
jgi:hypothetical protein